MAISFPADPTLNQQFTADGKTWYWDGEKWVAAYSPYPDFSLYAPLSSPTFTGMLSFDNIKERWNILESSISGTVNIDFLTSQNWFYSVGSTSGATTVNLDASSIISLSSLIPVGQSISYVVAVTTGSSTPGYFSQVQVDGTVSGVTTRWIGGVAPTGGDASSINVYTFTVVKTSSTPTYTVFSSVVKY